MRIKDFMTKFENLICAQEDITLKEANDIIWENKLNCLPIIDKNQRLISMVFRKDYNFHKKNKNELIDSSKRFMVGAGINTRNYEERIPALINSGADIFCIDSSEGYSEALAIGADFLMLGRYFARFDESSTKKININGNYMKEYWGKEVQEQETGKDMT